MRSQFTPCPSCGEPKSIKAALCRRCRFSERAERNNLPNPNPSGLCECGCGRPTTISPITDRRRGVVKGFPRRFVVGHASRSAPVDWIEEDRGYKTPCWIWQLATKEGGYGIINTDAGTRLAHIWSYEREYGPVPAGLVLDHLCRVHPCIRPTHLEAVTIGENARRGIKCRLSADQIPVIRAMAESGMTRRAIAAMFGVQHSTITNVVNGKSWPSDG